MKLFPVLAGGGLVVEMEGTVFFFFFPPFLAKRLQRQAKPSPGMDHTARSNLTVRLARYRVPAGPKISSPNLSPSSPNYNAPYRRRPPPILPPPPPPPPAGHIPIRSALLLHPAPRDGGGTRKMASSSAAPDSYPPLSPSPIITYPSLLTLTRKRAQLRSTARSHTTFTEHRQVTCRSTKRSGVGGIGTRPGYVGWRVTYSS